MKFDITAYRNAARYPTPGGVGRVLLFTGGLYLIASIFGPLALAKWSLLVGELALLLPALLYLRRHGYDYRTVFRLHLVSWRIVGLSVILGFAITVFAIELNHLVDLLLPFPEHLEEVMRQALTAHNLLDWMVILLAAVIFAGALEEMLFRGFVQSAFEQRHPPMLAIFITAILFGAVHLAPWRFVQFLFIAMLLGMLAWKSDSIIPSAIVHAQSNLIAVLLINLAPDQTGTWLDWQGHVHPVLLLVATPVMLYGFKLFNRVCEEEVQIPTLLNTPLR